MFAESFVQSANEPIRDYFTLLLLLCTCAASPRCGASCGPPACTEPWRASAPANTPPSDTRTPSSHRGCGRCWCAAGTIQSGSIITTYHNIRRLGTQVVTTHRVCVCVCVLLKTSQQILVFFPPEDSPSFMCPHTHCEWRCHPLWLTVIMHLSTGDKNYKSTVVVFSGCVCVRLCVCLFLKEQELLQIPVKVLRKSIYLCFLLLLDGSGSQRGEKFPVCLTFSISYSAS